jgi:hypothetical protein
MQQRQQSSADYAAPKTFIAEKFRERGFPEQDPLSAFLPDSEFAVLDEIGRDLPSMLHDRGFRQYARTLKIPLWSDSRAQQKDLPELRLYYVRVGFLASAYPPPFPLIGLALIIKPQQHHDLCRASLAGGLDPGMIVTDESSLTARSFLGAGKSSVGVIGAYVASSCHSPMKAMRVRR